MFVIQLVAVFLFIAGTSSNEFEDRCGFNTEPLSCGPPIGCEQTCRTRDVFIYCLAVCTDGCYCQSGYIREFPNGSCILESDCPEITTTTELPTSTEAASC